MTTGHGASDTFIDEVLDAKAYCTLFDANKCIEQMKYKDNLVVLELTFDCCKE